MRARFWLLLVMLSGCGSKDVSRTEVPAGMSPAMPRAEAPLMVVDDPGTWRRSTLPVHSSRVMVGDSRELPIEQVDLKIEVAGFRARVHSTFVFANPDTSIYEGTFSMRLADGASPYHLAFGQSLAEFTAPPEPPMANSTRWDKVRVARVVPRRAASAAYSETVHPRSVRIVVDPALAEWAGAGVFNMRVFPISPRMHHKVEFSYDVDLAPSGAELALELPLPARVPLVRAWVTAPEAVRVTPAGSPSISEGVAYHQYENLREQISLRVADRPTLMRWQDEVAGPLFAARVVPTLPDAPTAVVQPRAVFAVDTSLSSNPVRYNVWLALLREILNENRAELREFAVVFFNVEALWWQPKFVANTPENVAALLSYANTLALAGGTDMAAMLGQVATPPWPAKGPWDVFLLSDGAATWGEDDVQAAARRFAAEDCGDGKCPARLLAYRTQGVGVDPRLLGQLVRETGGSLIAVEGEASAGRVATAHRHQPWQLADVQIDGGSDIVVAGRPLTISAGQPLVIVGRGEPPKDAQLRLGLAMGANRQTVRVAMGTEVRSPLTSRVFGQVVVEQLEETIASTRQEAEVYARHFAVAGEACSLLMLESDADYTKHGLDSDPQGAAQVLKAPVRAALDAGAQQQAKEGMDPLPALMREFLIDARVTTLLSEAPREALVVPSTPLITRSSAWRDIPVVLRPQLEKQEIDEVLLRGHAAAVRAELGGPDGLKALSSLAEARPGDGPLLRGLGMTALVWGLPEAAYHLLHRASELSGRNATDHHLMANALVRLGKTELAIAHFETALAATRFEAEQTAVWIDYMRLLNLPYGHAATKAFMAARASERQGFSMTQGAPLVVTLHWSGDNADVDLHVTEPDGRDCHYADPTTAHGRLVLDASEDHGPEIYVGGVQWPGRYQVAAKLFSGTRHRASARTQVLISVYKDVGGPGATVERHVATLEPGRVPTVITTVEVP